MLSTCFNNKAYILKKSFSNLLQNRATFIANVSLTSRAPFSSYRTYSGSRTSYVPLVGAVVSALSTGAVVYLYWNDFSQSGNLFGSFTERIHKLLPWSLNYADSTGGGASDTLFFSSGTNNGLNTDSIMSSSFHKDISQWIPPLRTELISRLKASKDSQYDLLIIGGGATGAGSALEAASRGLKVACIEREDFASGTSSKSTKLVHGGVRYLEKAIKELDYEQYKLVTEALSERHTFLKIAPYLTVHLPIMLPIYKWYQVPYFWAGSKIYDLLSGTKGLESSYFLSRGKAIDIFPMLAQNNLVGAMVYYDGQQNDARMNVALALTAIYYGATVLNHAKVTKLLKKTDPNTQKTFLYGATVQDQLTNDVFDVYAKGIINATGPFCDAIRQMDDPKVANIVEPSSGVHVVLPDYYSPRNMGLLDPQTSDGRVIFFLPWEGGTIAGTTDTPCEVSYDPIPSEKEISFIMNEITNYFGDDIKVRRSDILSAWTGIRPLVKDPSAKSTEGLVRNHLIHVSENGLLTISGGKWTTYRNMAEETINEAIKIYKLQPLSPSITKDLMLIGSHGYRKTLYLKLIQQYGLDMEVAKHLVSSYGDCAFKVAAHSEINQNTAGKATWPIHGNRLVPFYPYITAEVKYCVRHEYALTAIDFLARRSRLSFLNAQAALDALPQVIRIMAKELGWSTKKQAQEYEDGKKFLYTMGLSKDVGLVLRDPLFNKTQIKEFQKLFESYDSGKSQAITSPEFRKLVKGLDMQIDDSKTQQILDKSGLSFADEKLRNIDFGLFLNLLEHLLPKEFLNDNNTYSSFNTNDGSSRGNTGSGTFENEGNIPPERSGGGV